MSDHEVSSTGFESAGRSIMDDAMISTTKDNVYCELEGEAVILNLRDGIYYGLNGVGLRIWELIQEPRSLGGILDALTEEYEVERTECRGDVVTLLGELAGKGMIEIREAS